MAQVFNVTSSSEIQVKGQANLSIPFSYDATTQQILFTVNLATGANLYTVTATNTAGTDSKSVTINYTPKATPILEKPPVVNFKSLLQVLFQLLMVLQLLSHCY
ncbi:MAG: hypothetical protein IPG89_20645 [Bacteroidetes bacterium]|nr:hypothetical protein [Bacteroidota bacterium]